MAINIVDITVKIDSPASAAATISDYESNLAGSTHEAKLQKINGKWIVVVKNKCFCVLGDTVSLTSWPWASLIPVIITLGYRSGRSLRLSPLQKPGFRNELRNNSYYVRRAYLPEGIALYPVRADTRLLGPIRTETRNSQRG